MQTQRLYRDVARCRSFSEAARLHGITQSAASQRIGQLEKKLGVTLLDRSMRPLGLTDAGRTYLLGVGEVLERYDRLERAVIAQGSARAGVRGRVRVAAIYSSGIDLLRRVGDDFAVDHPGIAVQVDYQKPDAVHESVLAGRADVGILSYPQRFKKVGVIPLRDEEMAVVCPPGHALARRRGVDPAALRGVEMLGFDTYLPVARGTADYLKAHGSQPELTHRFDNLDTLKAAVLATGRCAILPARTVRSEVAAGTLRAIALTPRLVRPMGLIYRRPAAAGRGGEARPAPGHASGPLGIANLPPVVSIFVEYLLQHAQEGETAADPTAPPGETVGRAAGRGGTAGGGGPERSSAGAVESGPTPAPNPAASPPSDAGHAGPRRRRGTPAVSAAPDVGPAASSASASVSARTRRPAVESPR